MPAASATEECAAIITCNGWNHLAGPTGEEVCKFIWNKSPKTYTSLLFNSLQESPLLTLQLLSHPIDSLSAFDVPLIHPVALHKFLVTSYSAQNTLQKKKSEIFAVKSENKNYSANAASCERCLFKGSFLFCLVFWVCLHVFLTNNYAYMHMHVRVCVGVRAREHIKGIWGFFGFGLSHTFGEGKL